jgi:hypothetical protein
MILYLTNGKTQEIEINQKIMDSESTKTAIYLLSGNCNDDYPSYSKGLGEYLEKIVRYNCRKYK